MKTTYQKMAHGRIERFIEICKVQSISKQMLMEKLGISDEANFLNYMAGNKTVSEKKMFLWCEILNISYHLVNNIPVQIEAIVQN